MNDQMETRQAITDGPPCTMDHAPPARLGRTIQRKTLLQASVGFGELHELENATARMRPRSHQPRTVTATMTAAEALYLQAMRALIGTEFAALLARADVSQAGFARLAGYTTRQVNNWCRARAAVPPGPRRWPSSCRTPRPRLSRSCSRSSVQLARDTRRAAQRRCRHNSPRLGQARPRPPSRQGRYPATDGPPECRL